ncbi:hypothetical protein [Oceaniglobus roseus]|uniref:hypothetical protein n=1 Tax=Oceaniglobus roseus TaxID=1737570 RepID=UPI000C7F0B48|nr:hypothetical protein [Kandeliimicrobium roseum]
MRGTPDPMLDSIADERMLEALFRAWTDAASLADARKIARHPLCPPSIVEAVAQRAEKPANDATLPNQKPRPQAAADEG